MATPQEKLAKSLKRLQELQTEDGAVALRSKDLPRTDRERLLNNGFIQEVMKGWYIPSRVDEASGESTAWYASFWQFCASYLEDRFKTKWCLSPEQSLSLHVGNRSVPRQLLVRSPKGNNNVTNLLQGTSILDVNGNIPEAKNRVQLEGVRAHSLEASLIGLAPTFYKQSPVDVKTGFLMLKDPSLLLSILLDGGRSLIAGRLIGAFRHVGRSSIADTIAQTMSSAGFAVQESDPFSTDSLTVITTKDMSPTATRIRLLWKRMRQPVMDTFPKPPAKAQGVSSYLKAVKASYTNDAYHSLSIEGYRVTNALIEKVSRGNWNPDGNDADRHQVDAMAARGYYLAFQSVQESLKAVLKGNHPGEVVQQDHSKWYRELFAPSVSVGILNPSELAGYRRSQVYIKGSLHIPVKAAMVSDCMEAFFDLLREEDDAAVRIVLGHFFFVNIHPYLDGNGRIGRFLMNVMMAAGGYPWTVITVEDRQRYMSALESASVDQDIIPFSKFIGSLPGRI